MFDARDVDHFKSVSQGFLFKVAESGVGDVFQ